MADDSVVRIMESLGLDYNPAISATLKFEKNITDLQTQLITLKATAGQTAKDINASFSGELSRLKASGFGVSGNTLVDLDNKAKESAQSQAKYNKELSELIHLRKTQQIDAQTFVDKASPLRTDSTTWESLQKQEQVKLVRELTNAEAEHQKVLNEKLKTESAINAAQEGNVQEIKQSTLASMEAQAASLQQNINAKGLSQEYQLQATLIRNQIAELQQKLAMEGKLSTEEVKQTAQLQEQLTVLKSQARAEIADSKNNNPNIFSEGFQRRAEWFLSGSLFFGVTQGAQEAIKAIADVETGVTEIARVMEDSSFQFERYRDSLLQFGVDYGQSFDNVQDIAARWAQAGYNVDDSLKNTKTSLLALNTAEMDAQTATEDLIGIMAQWQLTSTDLPLILDEVNKTADDFTVTSQDLVDGLLRSSGAAKLMGLSIEQTISLLTVMREASGRTGREVGNALNSILSYIQRPIAIKTLEDLGIQVFADAAKTQFRNVMDIFQDIAKKWPTLSTQVQDAFVKSADDAGLFNEELANAIGTQQEWNDLQQRDISQAAAGVYRRNFFIGMIERLSGAQKVLNNMTDAAGYSEAENARTMDTLAKKYQSLQTAATQLAVSMGDAGMTGVLKGLSDAGTGTLELLNSMDPDIRNFIVLWAELTLTIKTAQSALKLFGVTLPVVSSLTSGLGGLQTMVTTLGASIKGFFITNWPLLATTGVIAAIVAVVASINKAKEESKQFIEDTKKSVESLTEQKAGLQQVTTEYETLKSKEQNLTATADEKKRLLEIQRELVSQYGVAITGIDAEGQAYSDSVELIKLRTKAIEDEITAEQKKLDIAVQAKDSDDVNDIQGILNKRKLIVQQIKEIEAAIQKPFKSNGSTLVDYGSYDYFYTLEDAKKERVSLYNELQGLNSDLQKSSLDRQQLLQNDANSMIKKLQDNGEKVSDSARAFASEFAKSLAIQPKDIQTQKDSLKVFIEKLSSSDFDELIEKYNKFKASGDTTGIDSTSKSISDLTHALASGKPELDSFVLTMESMFGDSSIFNNSVAIPDFNSAMQDMTKTVDTAMKSIKDLDSVEKEIAKGHNLTAESITELLVKYPELASAVKETKTGYIIEKSALDDLRKAKIVEAQAALNSEIQKTKATLEQSKTRLQMYGVEISAIHDLKSAQEQQANLGFNEFGNGFDKYTFNDANHTITANGQILQYSKDEYTKIKQSYDEQRSISDALGNLGSLMESNKKLQGMLTDPKFITSGYEDSSDSKKTKKTSTENKALDNALKLLEHRKNMSEETQKSIEAEIKELNRINSAYVKTAEERMDIEERIYGAQKRLKDKKFQDSTDWINEQKELGKMSTQQEIAAWEKILKTQKDNSEAVKQATINLYKLKTQLAEETAQKEENSIEHWAKLGVYSTQQQIDKYQELYKVKAASQDEEYKRTENLFDLYKDLFGEQQKSIKDAYDERIKQIEDEAQKKKDAQQDIIDGIEDEEKALDRLEGQHDYANELADLRQQLAYWSVRTSEDARQKVADLNKQIAEKEHDHEVDLQKQALEDEKQTAQDAIDAIEKAANTEKEKWETSYKLIEKAFDEHSLDIVAMAGTMSQQAYQKWIDNYLIPLQNALKAGILGDFEKSSGNFESSILNLPSHDWGMSDKDYQDFISNGKQWADLQGKGYKESSNKEMQDLHASNDDLRKKYGQDPAKGAYPKFHSGAETLSYGWAYFKPGELVFPPHLSTDLKTIIQMSQAGAFKSSAQQSSTTDNRKQVQFNGPLLHVENMNMQDNADEQSLAGELRRVATRV
ncbi:MAG TPA: phage tail tape measure protein [Ruminiclostridium sp.]|nr:phage tail tape measure protein [Ruminiclostridium sp.]